MSKRYRVRPRRRVRRRAIKQTDANDKAYRMMKELAGDVRRLKDKFRKLTVWLPRGIDAPFSGDSNEAFAELWQTLEWAENQLRSGKHRN